MNIRPWFFVAVAATVILGLQAQFGPPPVRETRPWILQKNLSPDERADLVLAQMTLDEKIQLVHGAGMSGVPGMGPADPALVRANGGGGFVPGIDRLGLPDLNMADSSVGVGRGAMKGRYSTALPSTLALASSWDKKLAVEYGTLIGRELAEPGLQRLTGGRSGHNTGSAERSEF